MGPDGQLVVDEGTLTVQAQPQEVTRRNVISELPMLNSQSYAVNRAPSERWSSEETENFYAVRLAQSKAQPSRVFAATCGLDDSTWSSCSFLPGCV